MALWRSALAGAAALAGLAAACGLKSSVKDACVVDDDCNPGHVCMAGTCGVPGAPTADAGPEAGPLDASADTDDAPPPPPPFCANAPKTPPLVVCSDFDEKADAYAGWNNELDDMNLGLLGGGALVESSTQFLSPPRSAKFTLPPLVGSFSSAGASFVKLLSSTPQSLEIQLSFYIQTEEISATVGAGYAALVFVSFLPGGSISIDLESEGMALIVAGGVTDAGTPGSQTTYPFSKDAPFAVGMWTSLVVEIANAPVDGGPDGQITVTLGGLPAIHHSLPASFQVEGMQEVAIGPLGTGPMGELVIYMDNILIQN